MKYIEEAMEQKKMGNFFPDSAVQLLADDKYQANHANCHATVSMIGLIIMLMPARSC